MPFHIIEGDITTLNTDAIVNAANNSLLGGGGVDGAIHRAAGPKLLQECRTLNGCKTGEAKITDAYNLPSKKVIHTVGPVWHGGNHNEEKLLRSCYKKSLELAKANNLNSIAFPLISSGVYGYPKNQAFKVASETIEEFLQNNDLDIYLVIYDKNSFQLDKKLEKRLSKYIKVNFHKKLSRSSKLAKKASVHLRTASVHLRTAKVRKVRSVKPKRVELSLSERINDRGESFSDLLLRKIDEAHLTDPQCYKKANIDRRLFSKIKNNKEYNPSKETAIALALSLELSLDETNELLEKAGYVLSNNKLFDVIISYFIEHEDFNIYRINEALFHYGQKLLGA